MSELQKASFSAGKQEKGRKGKRKEKQVEEEKLTSTDSSSESDDSDVKREIEKIKKEKRIEKKEQEQRRKEKQLLEDINKYFCHDAEYGTSHGWPKRKTILCYKLEYDDVVDAGRSLAAQSPTWHRIQNTDRHTEVILVEELRRVLNQNCQVNIYLSNSPCKDCAKLLKSFLKETNVDMSIKIANFYNHTDQETKEGLCLLIKSGVQLSVFSGEKDWIQFYYDVTRNNHPKKSYIWKIKVYGYQKMERRR